MYINKFGISLNTRNTDDIRKSYETRNREYVRNHAMCLINADNETYFDAKSCKIKRLSSPDLDTDAANKRYVEACIQEIEDRCKSRIEDMRKTLENTIINYNMEWRAMLDQIQNNNMDVQSKIRSIEVSEINRNFVETSVQNVEERCNQKIEVFKQIIQDSFDKVVAEFNDWQSGRKNKKNE